MPKQFRFCPEKTAKLRRNESPCWKAKVSPQWRVVGFICLRIETTAGFRGLKHPYGCSYHVFSNPLYLLHELHLTYESQIRVFFGGGKNMWWPEKTRQNGREMQQMWRFWILYIWSSFHVSPHMSFEANIFSAIIPKWGVENSVSIIPS